MYQAFLDPDLPSTYRFIDHLPFAERVLDRELIGSPVYRALVAIQEQPTLAASFAAHAQAMLDTIQELSAQGDPELLELLSRQLEYHCGALSGISLAVAMTVSYPLSRLELTRLCLPALFEAATGANYAAAPALAVLEESRFEPNQSVVLCRKDSADETRGVIEVLGPRLLRVVSEHGQELFWHSGESLNGLYQIKVA